VAEQIEAAHKTSLAKGEVGIRERAPVPKLKDFADRDFLPFVKSHLCGQTTDGHVLRNNRRQSESPRSYREYCPERDHG
jgi:hypothetical protein